MNLNSSIITQEHIDQVTFELTEIIVEPAKKVGLCTKIRKNIKQRQRINTNKPWFNESCETSRKKYFKSKNAIWKSKTAKEKDQCIKNMKEKGKEYKSFISAVQKDFTKNLHKNLRELKTRNTKEYWKILKSAEGLEKKEPKIPLRTFEKHFKQLNYKIAEITPEFNTTNTEPLNLEINKDFTLDELREALKNLNNNKAEGNDFVKNEYLNYCPQMLSN